MTARLSTNCSTKKRRRTVNILAQRGCTAAPACQSPLLLRRSKSERFGNFPRPEAKRIAVIKGRNFSLQQLSKFGFPRTQPTLGDNPIETGVMIREKNAAIF